MKVSGIPAHALFDTGSTNTNSHVSENVANRLNLSIVNSQEKYRSNTKKEQGFLLKNGQFKIKKPKEKATEAIDPQWDTHLQ